MDIIAISSVSVIATMWALRRRPEDFQQELELTVDAGDLDIGDDPAPQILFQ
jgi:hypothetical protein